MSTYLHTYILPAKSVFGLGLRSLIFIIIDTESYARGSINLIVSLVITKGKC